jgi:putative hydrolase of the HAD superfamily
VSGEPGQALLERPDLSHVDAWLFDLDNTLYPLASGLAAQVSARITEFVADLTGLPHGDAHALQKRYLAEHGLTLRGLMLHHDVDPDVYHAWLHDVPLDCLSPDPALRTAIARLPGRRLIFTNADAIHAERVLERLELADLFEAVFHIGSAAFLPKPAESRPYSTSARRRSCRNRPRRPSCALSRRTASRPPARLSSTTPPTTWSRRRCSA